MKLGAGKLIICPTPIGNLGDMTSRAAEALTCADVVFAEDTRVTSKLLGALGISAPPLERLDENVMEQRAASVLERVSSGQTVVYATDAGMPGVSDPGLRLVEAAREAGLPVEVLPGATAATTAYVTSGFARASFFFGGFFPRKDGERRRLLESLAALDAALIFYESPHRVASALAAVAEVFPGRDVAVCRELTKLHEEVVRGPIAAVAADFAARDAVRGEVVLVIDGPAAYEGEASQAAAASAAAERARALLAEGERPKTVAATLAQEFSLARNAAYDLVLSLARD